MKNLRIQDDNRTEKGTQWKTLLRKYEERNFLLKKQEQALRLQFQIEQNTSNNQPSIHLHNLNLLPTKDENVNSKQNNQSPLQVLSHLKYAIRNKVPSLPLISANFQCSRKRLNITDKELNSSTYEDNCLNFQKCNKTRNEKTKHKCDKSDGKNALSKCELAQCKERHDKSEKYAQELNNLKFQLASTIQSMRGLESVNSELRKEMCLLKDKSNNVTKTFIDQKLDETHTIAKLREELLKNKKYFDDNASLCMLARRVSETLMEMANFTEVDLEEVEKRMEAIRKEEEALSKTEPSRNSKICICSNCCTCEEDLKKAKLREERIKQILSRKRDACTTNSLDALEAEDKPIKVIRGIELVCEGFGEGGGKLLDKLKGIELEEELESGAIIELLGEFDEEGEEIGEYGFDQFTGGPTGELAELEEEVRNLIQEDLLGFPSDYIADGGFPSDFVPDKELIETAGGPLAEVERDLISEADGSVLGDRVGYADDAAGAGFSEDAVDYAAAGSDYSEGAPSYAGASLDYAEGPGVTGYDDTGAPGYSGGGPDYSESGPGFTGTGPDSREDAGRGFAEGTSDFIGSGLQPSADASGYAGTGASYAEGGPGGTGASYAEGGPGGAGASYAEGGPGGTGASYAEGGPGGAGASYAEGGPGGTGAGIGGGASDSAGAGIGEGASYSAGAGAEDRTGQAGYGGPAADYREGTGASFAEGGPADTGIRPDRGEGESDFTGAGGGPTEGASDYVGASADVGDTPNVIGASESYAESAPSYTSGGPGYLEDASVDESGADYDKTKPSDTEDGSSFYDDDRNLSEADSNFYEEQISTAEDELADATGKTESGESISTKHSVYSEEGRNIEEEHPPGCECVDCICSGITEERESAEVEKTAKGILETIDEERLEEDGKQGRMGGERFIDEKDQVKGSEKVSPDTLESSKCLEKGTCTDMDDILKLLSSIEPCSCAPQEIKEKQKKKERRKDDSKTCVCVGEDRIESSSSEECPPVSCIVSTQACQDVISQIRDQFLPFQSSHDVTRPGEIGPDDYSITTAVADSGTIEIITEGPDGVIETSMTYTPSGNIDVKTEITEYECPVKEECLTRARESELYADITEPFEGGGQEDTDEIARDVADALNRANQEVMDALSRANQSVTDAMEKANRDVESALAMVMARKSSSPLGESETSEKAVQEDEGDVVGESGIVHGTESGEETGKPWKGDEEEGAYGEEKPGQGREDIDRLDEHGESFGKREGEDQWAADEERPVRDAEKGEKGWEDGERETGAAGKAGKDGWKGGDDGVGTDRGRGAEGWESSEGKAGGKAGEDGWKGGDEGVGIDRGRGAEGLESSEGKPGGGRERDDDVWESGEKGTRLGGETAGEEWESGEGKPGKEREGDVDAWETGAGKLDKDIGGEYEKEWRGDERGEYSQDTRGGENEWDDDRPGKEREDVERQWDRETIEDERGEAPDGMQIGGEGTADYVEDDISIHHEDETGECTCEECLNIEAGVLGAGDCTCTAECKCPICNDLKIIEKASRMPSSHPFGCTCIDCLCKENLLKETLGVHKHPPDCDCIACICGPGDPDKSKKQCHPPDCECLQCICSPTNATNELICKISVKFAEHPENCDCIDCICSKGIDVPEETGVGDTCKYLDIGKKETELELQIVKSAGDFAVETPCDHKPGCDCLECICETFESRIARKPDKSKSKSSQPHIHGFNCDCLECLCKLDSSCHSNESHPDNCDCVHCLCEGEREITTEDIEGEFGRNNEIVTSIKVRSQCPYPGHPAGCTCTENYLKRSFGYETKRSECPCSSEHLEPEILTLKMPTAETIEVTDIKRISSDSLLIKWTECALNETTGYEIFVNGVSKSRVYTKFRTAAVLTSLTFDSDLDIKVYATYYGGHLEPPAKAVFEVPNCDLMKGKKYCVK